MSGSSGGSGGNGYGAGGKHSTQNVDLKSNNAAGVEGGVHAQPKNILNALSEIQRFYIMEQRVTEELPKEYFTLEQIWDFFKIGFKSGMIEGLLFVTLLPFLQTIYPSFKYFFLGEPIGTAEQAMLEWSSYIPIVVSTIFMLFLSRYYEGGLTRRAIFALLNGRSFSFLIKGVGLYLVLSWLAKISYTDPNFVYSGISFFHWFVDLFLVMQLPIESVYFYFYKFLIPALNDTGKQILYSMMMFAALPYLTVFYKGYLRSRDKYRAADQYEKY